MAIVPDTSGWVIDFDAEILVTGGTGFIGSRLLHALQSWGFQRVRCLVRSSTSLDSLDESFNKATHGPRIEFMKGNLLSREDCKAAAQDAAVIYHLAAGTGTKSFADAFMNSVVTTRNLLDAVVKQGCLRRFVNVSSFSVYTNRGKPRHDVLDESCPTEDRPELRGDAYCFAKVKQDELVSEYGKNYGIPYVLVRPGVVYGPGKQRIHGRVGLDTFGFFLHLGGSNPIPFTFVTNCAEAIALAGLKKGIDGEVFNVVDDDPPSSRQFLKMYKKEVRPFRSVYVPHLVSYLLCFLWEKYAAWSRGQLPPVHNRREWAAFWKRTCYSNNKARRMLDWTPSVSIAEGLSLFFADCRERGLMLKIAIIGCGKIADDHLEQIQNIQRIRDCKVVAACDQEPLMAKQLAERFRVERYFGDAKEMLKECKPDVVHITTPPRSHHGLGKLCLERGCHVYIEKPFTVNLEEAEELIQLACREGLKITVGHDLQFSHVARRLRQLVRDGYLGGRPVHMESYYCYDLSDPGYAKAFLSNEHHWLRDLPGMLLHNIISHGIARIAEYLETDRPEVFAHGFVSPMLRGLGEGRIIDELRVVIMEKQRTTAYFTFSSQMRPSLNMFRMFGPKNGLVLDQDCETLLKLHGSTYKSYAEKFIPPVAFAWQQFANLTGNLRKFLANDFHMKTGMKYLIDSFYHSITNHLPPPIPLAQILLTVRIMDKIFDQLDCSREGPATLLRPSGTGASLRVI